MQQDEELLTSVSHPQSTFTPAAAAVTGVVLGAIFLGLGLLVASNIEFVWTWDYWAQVSVSSTEITTVTVDRSAILRNFGLLVLATVGLCLGVWRSVLAYQQNKTAIRQTENAIAQRRLSEKGLQVERFQKSASMLASEELTVRIAGVFSLRKLAENDPDEEYLEVLELLVAFVREKATLREEVNVYDADCNEEALQPEHRLPSDIGEAIGTISHIRKYVKDAKEREDDAGWYAELKDVNLSFAELRHVDLSVAQLHYAKFIGAQIIRSDFSGGDLWAADFHRAKFFNRVNVSGANLEFIHVSGADLGGLEYDETTNFRNIWAWESEPPIGLPDELLRELVVRGEDELDWDEFYQRVKGRTSTRPKSVSGEYS